MNDSLTRGILSATIGVALVVSGEAFVDRPAAGPRQRQASHARAAELIARGRSAIGPVDSLKSLSGIGTRRSVGSSSAGKPGPYELHFALPDRFVQLVTSLSPSTNEIRTFVFGFNGATALSGLRTTQPMLSGVREIDPTSEQRLFARLLLGWFLVAPSYLPVEFAYHGEAETADGHKAFVVDASGRDDFDVRLFLDETTCRPLMLTYEIKRRGAADTQPNGTPNQSGKNTTGAVVLASGDATARTYYSDVRAAGPFQIAHTVIDARDGKTTQELQFSKITSNPDLKPALFVNQ